MADESYWTTSNQTPAQPVMGQPPYYDTHDAAQTHIPGNAQGAISTAYTEAARFVYPHFDGVSNVLPGDLPANFAQTPPPLDDFLNWHSAHQAQWLHNGGTGRAANFSSGGQTVAYFRLSSDGATPVNLMALTLSDYAMLPEADKTAFQAELISLGVAERLGLASSTTAVLAGITALRDAINAATSEFSQPYRNMPTADAKVFTDQLDLLTRRVNSGGLVAQDTVLQEVAEIQERFERAKAFRNPRKAEPIKELNYNTVDHAREYTLRFTDDLDNTNGSPFGQFWSYNSEGPSTTGKLNSVDSGYLEFMRAERAILTMMNRREAITSTSLRNDPKLDVPNLIFRLQLLYQGQAEGIADSGTEEIRQLHKLLQDYGIMQRLVNEQLKFYDFSKPEEERRFMNLGGRADGGVNTDQTLNGYDLGTKFDYYGTNNDGTQQTASSTYSYTLPGTKNSLRHEDTARYPLALLTGVYGSASGWHRDDEEAIHNDWTDNGARGYWTDHLDNRETEYVFLSQQEMNVIMMFSGDSFGEYFNEEHPIEVLYDGLERPKQKFLDETDEGVGSLVLERKGYWEQFSTQLADTVTLLNQRNQIKQNEIENASKAQNRHFELGNNALRKMNDMLMTIGRI
ncbi:hypothetical protein [Pseudooceanicola aestuarii]|uniref:hypothetical protein n=1 Tax=Pseudooceanicola aestuarii TaxID=2697319 RepID=UPI0013D4F65D|nr:hypothetical protein [Pseudooceanicola aestuarii]